MLPFSGEPQALQSFQAADPHGLPGGILLFGRHDHDDVGFGLGQQGSVQAREALVIDLVEQFLCAFQVVLRAQLQCHEGLGPGAHAVSDIVPGHDKRLAPIIPSADDDVGMGMPGVEMVHGYPVELGIEVLLWAVSSRTSFSSRCSQNPTCMR